MAYHLAGILSNSEGKANEDSWAFIACLLSVLPLFLVRPNHHVMWALIPLM